MSMKPLLLLILTSFALSIGLGLAGCATLFGEEEVVLDLQSSPAGAQVYINDVDFGRTPLKVELEKEKKYHIVFKVKGREDKHVYLSNKIEPKWIILDFLAGAWPLIVDYATGAWYEVKQREIAISFDQ